MREIKFRAWDRDKKTMSEPFELESICEECGCYDSANFGTTQFGTTIMQFTGLLDKNGKEIYEGDIVRHRCYGENGTFTIDTIIGSKDCPFIGCGWIAERDGGTGQEPINEVIGNIHQNPELLPLT